MPKYSLANLGAMVKKKRGSRKLRETANDIGISAPTLLRIESGRMPDIETFGKVCTWLTVDPGDFLGKPIQQTAKATTEPTISAHFKADKAPEPATLHALARMLLLVVNSQPTGRDGHDA